MENMRLRMSSGFLSSETIALFAVYQKLILIFNGTLSIKIVAKLCRGIVFSVSFLKPILATENRFSILRF